MPHRNHLPLVGMLYRINLVVEEPLPGRSHTFDKINCLYDADNHPNPSEIIFELPKQMGAHATCTQKVDVVNSISSKDTENESHLDRYFLALAILSSVFLGFYVYTSISKYAHEEDLLKEVELANASQEEDGGNDQITIEGHPSPSPSVSNTTQADGSGEDKAESRPNKSQFYNLWRKVFTITATTRHLYKC
uniref:Uncharacterized protein n=1 Tax=Fagus sylvatica TaxID=28930 RepID=A0A2N9HGV3_FAGSY